MLDIALHDMGIVFEQNIDYFIGIFITDFKKIETAEKLVGRISKITYKSL